MKAEIVTIGTELLLGHIVDTNAAYLAQHLAANGVDLYYKTTVGDNVERIAGVIAQGIARSDVVITSGGLGPTVDDVTRDAIALATGRGLEFYPAAWEQIQAMFARWGRAPDENNRRQAMLPAGSILVPNPVGTAPAFIVETAGGTVFSLPGVPREMKHLAEGALIPYLRQRLGGQPPVIKSRVLRTCTIGESAIDTLIADLETGSNPTVGLAAHPGQTDIRITAKAASEAAADALIAPVEQEIRRRLGHAIYGVEQQTLEEVVARLLAEHQLTVALLETNTAGAIAGRLQATPHDRVVVAAHSFTQGAALVGALGLPEALLTVPWPDDDLALAAADALRAQSGADFALVILSSLEAHETLYTGERGRSICVLAYADGRLIRRYDLGGTGEVTQHWLGNRVLDWLRRVILKADM
jgi:nicotinamide-nucleotide amidase